MQGAAVMLGQFFSRQRTCIHALDADHALVAAQAVVQLAVADIDAHDLQSALLQQAVGEAAGGLADVEAAQAAHVQTGALECAFELEAAARDVFRLGGVEQLQFGSGGNLVAVLGDFFPRHRLVNPPVDTRGNQALGLGTGGGMAVFDQK